MPRVILEQLVSYGKVMLQLPRTTLHLWTLTLRVAMFYFARFHSPVSYFLSAVPLSVCMFFAIRFYYGSSSPTLPFVIFLCLNEMYIICFLLHRLFSHVRGATPMCKKAAAYG